MDCGWRTGRPPASPAGAQTDSVPPGGETIGPRPFTAGIDVVGDGGRGLGAAGAVRALAGPLARHRVVPAGGLNSTVGSDDADVIAAVGTRPPGAA